MGLAVLWVSRRLSVPEGFQRASGKNFGAPAGANLLPPPGGLTRRLRRGRWGCRLMGFHQLRCPKVSKGRAESPLVRPQAHTHCPGWGPDAPTTARMVGLPPRVGQYFLSKRKKVPKKASGTATLAARPAMRRGLRSAVAPSGLSSTLVRFAHPSGKKPFIAHF